MKTEHTTFIFRRSVIDMALRVKADTFEDEVLKADKAVLVDFYNDSCVPCKRMNPVLSKIEAEDPDVKIVKVNVNFDMELAEKYEVQAAPTFVIFRNGEEKARIRGAVKKEELEAAVKSAEA